MTNRERRGLAHRLTVEASGLMLLFHKLTDDAMAEAVQRIAFRLRAEADALRLNQGLPFDDEFMAPATTDEPRRRTNRDKVLSILKARGIATNHELRQVGGARAMARVWELKKQGYNIRTRQKHGGLWIVSYHDDSKSTSKPTS